MRVRAFARNSHSHLSHRPAMTSRCCGPLGRTWASLGGGVLQRGRRRSLELYLASSLGLGWLGWLEFGWGIG
eukprot:scaffold191057_cov37-Tisochrysis_lutea.AAC.1